jgi:hypothetical protein
MRKLFLITFLFLYSSGFIIFSQDVTSERHYPETPEYFIPKNHDSNFLKLNKLPSKSFYESKSDWQKIIDSTWGPGDPLPQKLLLFNAYAQKIHDKFDGFLSLQLNWDSLYLYYLNQINDSTSKGAFSAIMSHFSYSLKDLHTRAVDTSVVLSPLNPGVPILLLGSYLTVEHFGAVTTILPDSTTLVLRVVPNHPLNLEPGDIILGYEGVPWKDLVQELFDAGLPMLAYTGGCESANTYLSLFGAGINWHLFNSIDILKHSTGDTVHLSVLPLLDLNVPPMANNEQLPIPNIPFPDVITDQCATYGILENTNIGYIYLAGEWPENRADYEFFEAVNALKNTEALIIDMRLNYGGWAFFDNAFNILFNEFHTTMEETYRCNPSTFDLCPSGNINLYQIDGDTPEIYDRPIAVLLGPTCVSMGDITAQRFRYNPMIRFFGASSDASLGNNLFIENFPGWYLRYSICDMFHLSKPDEYLNRSEFPIDFPVWHNPDDVAIGKDAVVEKSLEWLGNLVYGHDLVTDKGYYTPDVDTVIVDAIIENKNSHQISSTLFFENLNGSLIDSTEMIELNLDAGNWQGKWIIPDSTENNFWISLRVTDMTEGTNSTSRHLTNITSVPLLIDSLVSDSISNFRYTFKPFLKNVGTSLTIENIIIKLTSNDPWVTLIFPEGGRGCPNLLPGDIKGVVQPFVVTYDSATFTRTFNLTFSISSNGWDYWQIDTTISIPVGISNEDLLPVNYTLGQNFPNPFNPVTTIKYQIPHRSNVSLKIYDLLGNEVANLVNEEQEVGFYNIDFNAAKLSSGVYFYRLQTGSFIQTKKMILLK